MNMLNEKDSLILIIDVQEKLLNAVFNSETVSKNAEIIAKAAGILNIPVVVTEQYPVGLGSTVDNLAEALSDTTRYFEKSTFSAFDNPEIVEIIRLSRCKQIILFGIETHICVNQTANALIEADYDVSVVADACGSRSEIEYQAGLDRIKENGGHIITTEIALFEWLKSAQHPMFKEVQKLIK
jgi:nicotinamidase-related amidase